MKFVLSIFCALTFVALPVLTGCVHTYVNPYPGERLVRTEPETVQVYRFAPPQPYRAIGEVTYRGDLYATWKGADRHFREEAAKLGGDAVIVSGKLKNASGIVIKFTKQTATQE